MSFFVNLLNKIKLIAFQQQELGSAKNISSAKNNSDEVKKELGLNHDKNKPNSSINFITKKFSKNKNNEQHNQQYNQQLVQNCNQYIKSFFLFVGIFVLCYKLIDPMKWFHNYMKTREDLYNNIVFGFQAFVFLMFYRAIQINLKQKKLNQNTSGECDFLTTFVVCFFNI